MPSKYPHFKTCLLMYTFQKAWLKLHAQARVIPTKSVQMLSQTVTIAPTKIMQVDIFVLQFGFSPSQMQKATTEESSTHLRMTMYLKKSVLMQTLGTYIYRLRFLSEYCPRILVMKLGAPDLKPMRYLSCKSVIGGMTTPYLTRKWNALGLHSLQSIIMVAIATFT